MKKKKRYRKKYSTPRQRRKYMIRRMKFGMFLMGVIFVILVICKVAGLGFFQKGYSEIGGEMVEAAEPELDVQLLTINPYSRPGTETDRITGIVVHYTANPGSTAMDNRNYFEGLKDSHETKASSNFVVGLEGEIVQCVPTWEVAYASNSRNHDTVSIECCHPDETGKFKDETYRSMVQLCSWLCLKFDLDEKDVIRHYDVTGKNCPKYFVENEEAWEAFRQDIKDALGRAEN